MEKTDYWESFYEKQYAPRVPSQFAAFTLTEIPSTANIIEIGCGNGRDALFFARYGHNIIAIDKAQGAIEAGRKRATQENLPVEFICSSISELPQRLAFLPQLKTPLILYSRFFLHSIDEQDEERFLHFCKICLECHKGKVFIEFRTEKDEYLYKKVEAAHFRRFIKVQDFACRAKQAGFHIEYSLEGKGFAKYGAEDAYVARFILCLPDSI